VQPNFPLADKVELVGVVALMENKLSRIKMHIPSAPSNEFDMMWREVSEKRMCS
jgi:hypothetical protein